MTSNSSYTHWEVIIFVILFVKSLRGSLFSEPDAKRFT